MKKIVEERKEATGFFTTAFYYAFRSIFIPVTRLFIALHITPNMVTWLSFALGMAMCVLFAFNQLGWGLIVGLAMGFADIIDGQLAKSTGMTSKFGGILDSTIDRYNEFFIFIGLGLRYNFLGRPVFVLWCAVAFLGSVMVSYIKARAESDGFDCRVGKLQRPERLALIGIGILLNVLGFPYGIDAVVLFLAFGTQYTSIHRLAHVYKQTLNVDKM